MPHRGEEARFQSLTRLPQELVAAGRNTHTYMYWECFGYIYTYVYVLGVWRHWEDSGIFKTAFCFQTFCRTRQCFKSYINTRLNFGDHAIMNEIIIEYVELVNFGHTIEIHIDSIFRKYTHLETMCSDYAKALVLHAAVCDVDFSLILLSRTYTTMTSFINPEARKTYQDQKDASMQLINDRLLKFKTHIRNLGIRHTDSEFANSTGTPAENSVSLLERSRMIQGLVKCLLRRNKKYTEMMDVNCAEALVLNAAICEIEYLLKMLRTTYKNLEPLTGSSDEREKFKADSKTSMSTQKKALALFKASVPMDVMCCRLGITRTSTDATNSANVSANQARIDILHQAMNNLCAVFAFYGIDGTICMSVCNHFGVQNVHDMACFDIGNWSTYVAEYYTPNASILFQRIQNIIAGLGASHFDFHSFHLLHPNCRPVQVDNHHRIEWQPHHCPHP